MEAIVNRMLRIRAVADKTGNGKSTIYALIREGLFPQPVRLSEKVSVWPEREVDAINDARIAGRTVDQIKQLVIDLEKKRQAAAA